MPTSRYCLNILAVLAATSALFGVVDSACADALIVITTDSNLNDNGRIDEFVAVPDDGNPHTIYIWAASTPTTESLFEFNFDLNTSGADLTFSNATIGLAFTNVSGSIVDTNLNDNQFGWSAFTGTPPVLGPCPDYTLLATIDVSVASGARIGQETALILDGPQFRLLGQLSPAIDIVPIGPSRDLALGDLALLCEDLAAVCGDGVIEGNEQCDPPSATCDISCQRIPICGDGIVDTPEACDDSNLTPGDGCDASCQLEPLLNDDCANATTINDGATAFYTNDATTDGPSHAGICQFDGQTYNDIWFDYVATCTGELTVSLCGSQYDTDLVLYDSCVCPTPGATPLACNDDGCPGIPPMSYRSKVATPVVSGSCYKIRIGGFTDSDAGAGDVLITCSECTIDGDCDDGVFCNGLETCTAAGMCQISGNPCPGEVCVEASQSCVLPQPGDTDLDGDVDLIDALNLSDCIDGPATSLPDCNSTDFDGDVDTDLFDASLQQANFTGSN